MHVARFIFFRVGAGPGKRPATDPSFSGDRRGGHPSKLCVGGCAAHAAWLTHGTRAPLPLSRRSARLSRSPPAERGQRPERRCCAYVLTSSTCCCCCMRHCTAASYAGKCQTGIGGCSIAALGIACCRCAGRRPPEPGAAKSGCRKSCTACSPVLVGPPVFGSEPIGRATPRLYWPDVSLSLFVGWLAIDPA